MCVCVCDADADTDSPRRFFLVHSDGIDALVDGLQVIAGAKLVSKVYERTALLRQAKVLGALTGILRQLSKYKFAVSP